MTHGNWLLPALLARPGGAGASAEQASAAASAQADARAAKESELYERGSEALDDEEWKKAAEAFQQVAQMGGAKADAALYWVAYSLNQQGRKGEALTTLRAFWEKYPKSRWKKEARALELEIRQRGGRGE